MRTSTPDPRALGHLLVLQGGIQLMASEAQLCAMVSRGLDRVPGIASAQVRLDGVGGEPPCAPEPLVELPLDTLRQHYGCLAIEISDPHEYAPYAPFLRNLAGTIALWLESQNRRRELETTLQQLESALHDRSQALHEAQVAVRTRETILSVVSHDLRNPLAAIAGLVGLLRKAAGTEQRLAKMTDIIERSVNRMNRMIRDLLDLASIDSGHLSIEPRPNDLELLVGEALEGVQWMATQKTITLTVEVAGDVPSIACDGHRVVQVLSNLLGNAIKFTPVGGSVSLLVQRRADDVLVTVSDTGPGIAEEDLPRLFDRYYRGQNVRKNGTGLGLSIAKALVDLHHGSIGVESAPPAGSRFFFTLPLPPS